MLERLKSANVRLGVTLFTTLLLTVVIVAVAPANAEKSGRVGERSSGSDNDPKSSTSDEPTTSKPDHPSSSPTTTTPKSVASCIRAAVKAKEAAGKGTTEPEDRHLAVLIQQDPQMVVLVFAIEAPSCPPEAVQVVCADGAPAAAESPVLVHLNKTEAALVDEHNEVVTQVNALATCTPAQQQKFTDDMGAGIDFLKRKVTPASSGEIPGTVDTQPKVAGSPGKNR